MACVPYTPVQGMAMEVFAIDFKCYPPIGGQL
jgi:hypothetical protein